MKRLLLALLLANAAFFGYTQLIDESGPATGTADTGPAIPRLSLLSELKVPPGPSCLSIGPFGDRAVAEQASAWLKNGHHLARARTAEVDGAPTYWVAIATKTLQQAARISMRLKAAGVSDIDITPPGTNQTEATVSLGLYSERERAERRVSDLRRLGVDPAIIEQPHKVSQVWLDVILRPGDPPLDVSALGKAVSGAASTSAVPCPGAGSPATPPGPGQSPSPSPPAKLPGAPA